MYVQGTSLVYSVLNQQKNSEEYTTLYFSEYSCSSYAFYYNTTANSSASHNICLSAVYVMFEDLKSFLYVSMSVADVFWVD